MPIVSGNYAAPTWVNDAPPAINASELQAMSDTIESNQTGLNSKAPLASPKFTGTPTAPTAASGTETTQIATTAFVQGEIADNYRVSFYSTRSLFPSNGDASVIYVAKNTNNLFRWNVSTSEYLKLGNYDGSISDLESTIASINTGEISPYLETTDTASRAYSIGRYFIRQDGNTYELCIARTAIAQGDTLNGTAGGNYLTSTVTEELETVNAWLDDIQSDVDNKLDPLYTPKTLTGSVVTFDDGLDGALLGSLSVAIEPVQASGTPTPENPLPISGWSGANVTRTGKNILGGNAMREMVVRHGGKIVEETGAWRIVAGPAISKKIYIEGIFKENTQYTFLLSGYTQISSGTAYLNLSIRYTDNTTSSVGAASSKELIRKVSAANKTIKCIEGNYAGGTTYIFPDESGIFEGVVETIEFEPYAGETLSIPFGQTVYGGTLDVVSGKLTVDREILDLKDVNWLYNGTYAHFYADVSASKSYADGEKPSLLCTCYDTITTRGTSSWGSAATNSIGYRTNTNVMAIKDTRFSSAEDLIAFLTQADVKAVYALATPQVYYLAPHEVQTILGLNNIYADCGNVSVTYRGDVLNLYEKVADTKNDLSAFFANIAPIDDSPTASAPIQAYQLMMHNGRLYKTTRAIATDEMYVVAESMNDANGNIIPTSLGAEINIINAHLND